LELSSQGWHEGKHNPWALVNFMLYILKQAYTEFEKRAGEVKSPRGSKTELVMSAIESMDEEFSLTDLEHKVPSVNRDLVRSVLKKLRKEGIIKPFGRGPNARWHKK